MSRKELLMVGLLVLLGTGVGTVLPGRTASADSQQSDLRLEGRVQWIAGQTMILTTNTDLMGSYVPQAPWSVRVDLTRVPQDEYGTLAQGDFVAVTGLLSEDNRLVVGASIERLGS